jgi:hypothetical protein
MDAKYELMRLRCPKDRVGVESNHLAVDVRLPLGITALSKVTKSLSACVCGAAMVLGTDGPVCSVCNDTHTMTLGDEMGFDARQVMCTHCPVPCESCRSKPQGPYCAKTPCGCECHAKSRSR